MAHRSIASVATFAQAALEVSCSCPNRPALGADRCDELHKVRRMARVTGSAPSARSGVLLLLRSQVQPWSKARRMESKGRKAHEWQVYQDHVQPSTKQDRISSTTVLGAVMEAS